MTQEKAFEILTTGIDVFLTGEPGSGKTHTVNRYVTWLRDRGINVAVTASTGIAATHIGGRTIHSWSGIGTRTMLTQSDVNKIAGNARTAKQIRETRVLVIDEISMLSSDTLVAVEMVCRSLRKNSDPFGGMQVVMVGDFFQLPPVVRQEIGEEKQQTLLGVTEKKSPFAFSSAAWKRLNPTVCYLSEQHRQEDTIFLQLLSAIRRGIVDASHIALLNKCVAPAGKTGVTQLFSHNVDVDRINEIQLSQLSGDAKTFVMEDRGPAELVTQLKRGCLSPEILILKIGARIMFTKNDPALRFVNGTTGIVTGFSQGSGHPVVHTHSGRTVNVEPMGWNIEEQGAILACITQIPLRLAWALTIHKSQGMSLDVAHMDLSRVFEYGQGYVALSRVRTLAGLSLAGFNQRALCIHPEIRLKDAGFCAASETAQKEVQALSREDLLRRQQDFIEKCGGKNIKGQHANPERKKIYSVKNIREKHANAYRSWSAEEDEMLLCQLQSGDTVGEIAQSFGRKQGAICSRIKKLKEREE